MQVFEPGVLGLNEQTNTMNGLWAVSVVENGVLSRTNLTKATPNHRDQTTQCMD